MRTPNTPLLLYQLSGAILTSRNRARSAEQKVAQLESVVGEYQALLARLVAEKASMTQFFSLYTLLPPLLLPQHMWAILFTFIF